MTTSTLTWADVEDADVEEPPRKTRTTLNDTTCPAYQSSAHPVTSLDDILKDVLKDEYFHASYLPVQGR